MILKWATGASVSLAIVSSCMLLEAQKKLGERTERCNREKVEEVAAARELAAAAERRETARLLQELRERLETEAELRRMADEARMVAETRPVEVREVIRNVTTPENCLAKPVDRAVIECLRDGTCDHAAGDT
jgi:sRNA-binding protein